jgi:tetratricopeptide (TPR) repeat protein
MRISRTVRVAGVLGTILFLTAPEVQAQMARISGTVVDPDHQPIAGVTVTVTTPDSGQFELVKTTSKKGKVTLPFNNLEWQYEIRFEKEGFQTRTEPLRLTPGRTVREQWVMAPVATGAGAGEPGGGGEGGGSRAVRTFNEGVEAQRLGDLDLAADKYRRAAEINPELAAPHTALAAVASLREDWETAAAEAESALSLDPKDTRAMQLRYDAYRKLGDEAKASEAAAALREVGDLESAAARIFNEGVDAFNAGDVATAQSKFEQTIELSPEFVPAYVALAQISISQGSAAEALAMAQSALEREPENAHALKVAFDGARLTGDQETAGSFLDRLLEVEPQWITTTLFDHAVQLFNNNQPEAAAFELQYVLKADPDMARAHFMLGMALFNSGRTEEGRAHLEKFVELAPDDPDVEIAKGLLSYQE